MLNDVMRKKPNSDKEFYELLDQKEAVWKSMVKVLNHHIRPFCLARGTFRLYVYDAHPLLMDKWVAPDPAPDVVQSEGTDNCQP